MRVAITSFPRLPFSLAAMGVWKCALGWFPWWSQKQLDGESFMLTSEQINEVRTLARLEALRSSVFSVASESLDDQTPRIVVTCTWSDDAFDAFYQFQDSKGITVTGGAL